MTQQVYVIAANDSGPCKIGRAKSPANRIVTLQTGNHEKLRVVAAVETDDAAGKGGLK